MLVVQREPPCDVVIYGASLRCLSGARTAAVNFAQHGVLAMFEGLCFAVAQVVVYALVSDNNRTNFCDTGCKNRAELREPFY